MTTTNDYRPITDGVFDYYLFLTWLNLKLQMS